MKRWLVLFGLLPVVAAVVAGVSLSAAEPAAPPAKVDPSTPLRASFATKPRMEKDGKAWRITFAVAAPTDATVAIVSPEGKVVRHLAAGLLGPKAPEPFKAGLEQSLSWDGLDDDGKPVPADAKLRVALGLRPEFARLLCPAKEGVASRGPIGIAVDRQGNLYVEEGSLWVAGVTTVLTVKAFDSEGKYLKTVMPFRADCPPEKVSEVEYITTLDGRRVPLSGPHNHRPYSGFTPGTPGMTRHVPVITADGKMLFPCGEVVAGKRRFLSIGIDGSAPRELYEGPELQAEAKGGANIFLALSPDDKYLYFAGARSKRGNGSALTHAIYRIKLPRPTAGAPEAKDAAAPPAPAGEETPGPAKAFLGKEFKAGSGDGEFNDPRGLDTDAQGRIYVGDFMNDRVQVFSPEGKFLKALEVKGPEQVKVHPKTGAVYVLSVQDAGVTDQYNNNEVVWEVFEQKSVIKFASLDDWKKVAEVELPKRKRHMHDCGPVMALDASREGPVIWIANVGRQEPGDMLWKVVDRGDKLEPVPHGVLRLDRRMQISPPLAADRRNNELYAFETPAGSVRIDAATGETKQVELLGEAGKAALERVGAAAVGPQGMLYLRSGKVVAKGEMRWFIRRFDRKGEPVPFEAGEAIETNGKHSGTYWGEQPTYFAVGPDGKLYVVGYGTREAKTCRMDVYGADGKLAVPGLLAMTPSGGCVRVDPLGRLYAADTVRPKERAFPECYPDDPRKHFTKWYGTVFRFDAAGGGVTPAEPELATHFSGGKGQGAKPAVVKGALWGHYGISPMPMASGCECVIAEFDVDGWGRLWVPDAPGCSVTVLDSAGNVLTRFGAYGNRDATGAGGAVPEPPIPMWVPERVAALDGDAFAVDSHNCRIVQVRLKSAATEEVPVP